MDGEFDLKKSFVRAVLLLPLIYVGFGWYVGLNYGRKPVIFGPYPDVPVVISNSILGSPVKELTGTDAIVYVSSQRHAQGAGKGRDKAYFNIQGYFELPGSWRFDFPPSYNREAKYIPKKTFLLTGGYSRAIAHELKNPKRKLGYYSLYELHSFLKATGKTKDLKKLKPYLFLAGLEEKFPHLYSETVLVSKAMGNVFSDKLLPYDVLGLFGICILFIALATRRAWLWVYYLYWVASYWFGRIGFHDPNLAFTSDGWQVICWSFWHGFIVKDGRLFLVIVLGVSAIVFGISGLTYIAKRIFHAKDTGWRSCKSLNRKVNRYAF